jgi:DNA helicase-2/ATP-dependent DNA helicase PcrA
MNFITQNLNPEQLRAVETLNGPLIIFAGAGSGKTRVLTHRIANIIVNGLAEPQEILAVTFTNKAAKEMRERALNLLHKLNMYSSQSPWISTFHSFCVQVLRSYIHILDYGSDFTIYDRADQLSLVRKIFKKLNLDTKTYSVQTFLSTINTSKIYGVSPEDLLKEAVHGVDRKVAEVYDLYEKQMKEANALDFDDLMIKTIQLFKKSPDVLEFYQNELKYILVDEYQDTSTLQYELIHMLANKHRNLCVVGDEDQSIYSWRGANIENILSFETDYPEAAVIKLEENYRSTQTIVNAASEVIKNNNIRKDKTLHTNNKEGDKIIAREVASEYDEGKFVAQNIQTIMKDHSNSYDDIAIFYRTNSQSRAIEEELRSYRIPYQIIGGMKFYDRMEVKDLICYLRLVMNENDDVSFMRVLNVPTRGIGKVTADKIIDLAHSKNQSLMKASQEICDHGGLNAGSAKKLQSFVNIVQYLRVQAQEQKPSEFIKFMIDHLKFVDYLKFEKPDDYPQRVDNLNELINAITKFEKERGSDATLGQFLEEVALVSDIDELDEAQHSVKMMTLHISKGLEYPYVFIVGFEEGLFPSNQSIESTNPEQMEEERRLCYVGMTRAKEKLFLSYSRRRMQWGQELINPPSRFLKEIPAKYIDSQSAIARPKFFQTKEVYNFEKTNLNDPFPDYEKTYETTDTSGFSKGMKVRHPSFGIGIIDLLEGNGEDQKVTILFKNHPKKKFILKYARLERL